MTPLKKLTAPPVFDDDAKTRQAKLLNFILWGLVIVPIPYLLYILIQEPEFATRALTQFIFSEAANIFLLWFMRRGNVRMASILHISLLWMLFTVTAFTGEGVNGKAYLLGYPLVIIIAGALLGTKGALTSTAIALASGGVMVIAQTEGWVEIIPITTSTATWVITLAVFPMLVLLQYLTGSELRDAVARAHASEERYRLISQVASDYTFSTALDSNGVMYLNWVAGAFEKITGFNFEEYVASGGWLAHLHPEDIEKDANDMAILKTNKPVISEIRTFKKNGDISWVRVYAHPIWDEKQNTMTGIIGAVQDITGRKQDEEALTRERDLLQIFMDNIPDHVYFKDAESRFIRVNKSQATFLGLNDPQSAIGRTDLDFQPIELARQFMEEEKQIIETGQPVVNRIEFNPTKDGKQRWISATKVPVRDSSGHTLGTIGISRDITEQKLTEAMLAYERDILQIFMDNIPDQIYFKDIESRFVRINQGQALFLGVDTPEDAIGKTDLDFQPPELAQEFLAEEKRIMETGQPVLNRIEFNPTSDGKPRWLSTSKVPAKNELGQVIGTIGMSIDVTEQRLADKLEENRRKMLEKIMELGKQVAEVSDLRTTLKRIWHAVRYDLDFDRLGIYLYDSEHNAMDGTYGTNNIGEIVDEWDSHIPLVDETVETTSFMKVLRKENGIYITHNYEVEHNISEGDIMDGVKDFAAVAAWAGNKPVSVICVDQHNSMRPITDQQLEALRLFAGYAGLAIENARLKDAIQNELNEKKQAEETEQRRRQILEKVVQLGKQVTEVSDLRTTLEKIWYALHEGLNFDRIGIFSYSPETNSISRMLGTDIHGNRDDTAGEPVRISEWSAFHHVLEKPDGFYFTHNFSHEAAIPENQEMYNVRDYATVAAWAGGKPIAVIAVDQLITQRPITEQQVEALRLFAGYAGLAIENSRLKDTIQNELDEKKQAEENEQRRRIMLEKVVQLGKQITAISDFRATLQTIWHIVRYDLDFDRVGLFLYNPEDNTYDGSYGTDREGNIWEAWHVKFGLDSNTIFEKSMVFSKVLNHPDGFYFTKDYEDEFKIGPNEQMAGVKYYAVVAVWSGDKPMAIIAVDQLVTGRAFTDEQLEALRLLAGYAGFAIENSRLKEALLAELAEQKRQEENEQRRRMTVEKVMQLGKQVTEVSDFQTTLRKIWKGVRYELDFDRVGLFLFNPKENIMEGAYGTDREGKIWDAWHVKFGLDEDALFYKVLSRPDGLYFSTDYEKERNLPPGHDMAGVKYYAVVAVWAGNKPVALISVDQLVTGRTISDEQLEALRLFAGYAGLAISNAKLNDALATELLQRQTFIDELEAKNAELERFTYTASHDLKSPLVTITGFLGYLEKDALTGNQERMKSSIARINSAAAKMQELLNDLLELSRIGRLMNPAEDIPFGEIVHEAVDRVRGRLDEAKAVVKIQGDFPIVRCDRVRLVEVVQNLIENAIKYARPNSIPHIEIGSNSVIENGQSIFHVRDDGIGIAPQYHERIFGLFNKLDAQSEGTGIGLSLVKRIIEVHGGRVWVESEKDMGATFYFSLPTSQTKE